MIPKTVKRQALELLGTILEGIAYAGKTSGEVAVSVLESCKLAIDQVSQAVQENAPAISRYCLEKFVDIRADLDRGCAEGGLTPNRAQIAAQRIRAVLKKLQNEPTTIEVVFFPYKASMWDCMDSVWRAANADPSCECYVVPIPYYDRNPDRSLGKLHYEGAQFPSDVPVVDYKSYDIAERKPDIAYIHNPYDEFNYVTSVHPDYYSHELKKHINMLVYLHYGLVMRDTESTAQYLPAYKYTDYVIVPSEQMKQCLVSRNVQHILALGSPKLDYIKNHPIETYPSDWNAKLRDRTVFLVNSSLADLLGHRKEWLLELKNMLTWLANCKGCGVIWRPHPLMEATIKSMRKEWDEFYQNMKRELLALDHFVFDQSSDYMSAFSASHAMISDFSSLALMYGVTGKPVLMLTGSKSEKRSAQYVISDYYDYYFLEDGMAINAFVGMVQNGQDINREKRMASLFTCFLNMDGSAGEHIHKEIAILASSRNAHNYS